MHYNGGTSSITPPRHSQPSLNFKLSQVCPLQKVLSLQIPANFEENISFKMWHYQNISKHGTGFREILSQCTEYMVINMQALEHISHSFQVLPSTYQNWLPTKMFTKCQRYNIIWKHKSSPTRIQTLVYPMYAALAQNKTLHT